MNCHTNILPSPTNWRRSAIVTGPACPSLGSRSTTCRSTPTSTTAHINAGVGCVECHGRIDQMERVQTVQPLNMGWCVECHRDPQLLRPKDQVTNMLWTPPDEREA